MRNSLNDLNEYLFAQLDALQNTDLKGAELQEEIDRSNATVNIAKAIIDGGELALKAKKHADEWETGSEMKIALLEG